MNKLKEHYKRAFLICVIITALIPVLITVYEIMILGEDSVGFTFNSIVGLVVVLYYALLILVGMALFGYWMVRQIKMIAQLKNEKKSAELLHLKAQVNPHFFFNMLNNLYGLIDKDAEKAKNLILKLSEMMRYSIYEGQKDKVTLKEEIDFLKNYIELQKMRYHKNIVIDFSMEIEEEDTKVMPLLFIILVENAFKHGVETLRNNAFVNLIIHSNEEGISFKIENNFEEEKTEVEGIGLQNLQRRLNLVYPNHHRLTTERNKNIFTSQLTLMKL